MMCFCWDGLCSCWDGLIASMRILQPVVISAAVRQDRYYEMGCLMALSMLHGGPPPSFFSKALYFSLFHFPKDFQFSFSDLNEIGLVNKMRKVMPCHIHFFCLFKKTLNIP